MRDSVLTRISGDDLAVYAVWEPILPLDDEKAARRASRVFPEDRVTSFWTGTKDVGLLFRDAIGLSETPAWDVYLVYPPGVSWTGDTPPKPVFFMHQLTGRLPEDRRLDGGRLAAEIRRVTNRPRP